MHGSRLCGICLLPLYVLLSSSLLSYTRALGYVRGADNTLASTERVEAQVVVSASGNVVPLRSEHARSASPGHMLGDALAAASLSEEEKDPAAQHGAAPADNAARSTGGRARDRARESSGGHPSAHGLPTGRSGKHGHKGTGHTEMRASLSKAQSSFMVIKIMCCGALVAIFLFEVLHTRVTGVNFSEQLEGTSDASPSAQGAASNGWTACISRAAGLARRSLFTADGKKLIIGMLSGIIAMEIMILWLAKSFAEYSSSYFNALQSKDAQIFYDTFREVLFLVCLFIAVRIYAIYVKAWLNVAWRTQLTDYLMKRWLHNGNFYKMNLYRQTAEAQGAGGDQEQLSTAASAGFKVEPRCLENPDQRIQEDCDMFTRYSSALTVEGISQLGYLCVFFPMLWSISPQKPFPGWLALSALGVAIISSAVTQLLGGQMVNQQFALQRYEADFRSRLIRVRDNSEEIALYGAEAVERASGVDAFSRVRRMVWELMMTSKRVNGFAFFNSYATELLPILALAPFYFEGTITFGIFIQTRVALGYVLGALNWFVDSYASLAAWRAVTCRLTQFESAMTDMERAQGLSRLPKKASDDDDMEAGNAEDEVDWASAEAEAGVLKIKALQVQLPTGKSLVAVDSMELRKGTWTLVAGPEGAGKTTLLRSVAGIWPFVNEEAYSLCPLDEQDMLFLPQKPTGVLREGSLRRAITYPRAEGAFEDDAIVEMLSTVGLAHLLTGNKEGDGSGAAAAVADLTTAQLEGALANDANWGLRLSLGEQQKLNIAHTLLAKPKWLFLDECTSSTRSHGELYALLKKHLPADTGVVSVAHNVKDVAAFHDSSIVLDGLGGLTHRDGTPLVPQAEAAVTASTRL